MILYIDTSVLVKRYIAEVGSRTVATLIEQANVVGSTLLTQVEMAAALSKSVRMQATNAQEAELA